MAGSKHDADCLRRRDSERTRYLCTCDLTDEEVHVAISRAMPEYECANCYRDSQCLTEPCPLGQHADWLSGDPSSTLDEIAAAGPPYPDGEAPTLDELLGWPAPTSPSEADDA